MTEPNIKNALWKRIGARMDVSPARLACFLRLLPDKLSVNNEFRALASNIGWLFFDKIFRMGLGLLISVWIARSLGPQDFGLYSYSLSFVAIFSAFSSLGLDSIVIRDLIRSPEQANEILGSAFLLKLIAGLLAAVFSILTALFLKNGDSQAILLITLMSVGLIFQSTGVIDFYFQSQVKARYVVLAQNCAFLVAGAIKGILILRQANVTAFALANLFELFIVSALLLLAYRHNKRKAFEWRPTFRHSRQLLNQSWPLMMAFVSYMLYTRIDQLMIDRLLDSRSVGIYSAAYRIYEIPIFLVLITSQSVTPMMYNLFENDSIAYFSRYLQFTSAATWTSYILLVFTLFFGRYFVEILYGPAFSEAAQILGILMFGQIAMFNGFLRSSHLTIANKQKIIFATTVGSALLNISLNVLLIPNFGLKGAAIAAVTTQFISLFFSNLINKDTRQIFQLQLRGMIVPPTQLLIERTAK